MKLNALKIIYIIVVIIYKFIKNYRIIKSIQKSDNIDAKLIRTDKNVKQNKRNLTKMFHIFNFCGII